MCRKKLILAIEDNAINLEILKGILISQYSVVTAENGQEALSVLKQYGEEISLILLDIVMPVMDGYTFLSIIKDDPAYASIPVIVTTQNDKESDEVAALSHGATDFVVKPYRPQIILHRVASIIHLRETAAMINLVRKDRLTGLYSKEFFYHRMREIIVSNPDKKYDILCSDILDFKLINDIFGIPSGNRLLCGMAELYMKWIGDNGICGRINADQFVCCLERGHDYSDSIFANATRAVNNVFHSKKVIVKWGIYQINDITVPVEQMCDCAVLAVRSIKEQYGKNFAIYDDALQIKLLEEKEITDGMDEALSENQFEVYLQPKYKIENNTLAGAEALVRWNHPRRGIMPPGQFVPLFEKNGFITKMDEYVWDKTCAILHKWDEEGYPPIAVSVNVSRADIYNDNLANILVKTVEKYNLPPSRLHLEITESGYLEDVKLLIDEVRNLRSLGFVIEMDDFGSGYSSFNLLNEMPIDILKLDMEFIRSEIKKPVDKGLLQHIMGIARTMELKVIAEGVETEEQLERLREFGCDYAQGYYFSKPIPVKEFELLMKSSLAR